MAMCFGLNGLVGTAMKLAPGGPVQPVLAVARMSLLHALSCRPRPLLQTHMLKQKSIAIEALEHPKPLTWVVRTMLRMRDGRVLMP